MNEYPSQSPEPDGQQQQFMSFARRDARRASNNGLGVRRPSSAGLKGIQGLQNGTYGSIEEEGLDGLGGAAEELTIKVSMRNFLSLILSKKISVLLVFLPFGYISQLHNWSDKSIFWSNFLAMIPLASILGDLTEELAMHTNQIIGGLLNATFGNAVEVVVAINALNSGQIRVVQASMLGSVFSNLLLVLGCCFFFGGLKFKEQSFNSTSATANMSLLMLSSMALILPTPFAEYYDVGNVEVLMISRIAACFLLAMYLQLLVFQLFSHAYLMEEEDDGEEPSMSFLFAGLGLLFVTILVAIFSEYLVQSIDGFTETSGISKTFVGLIILPIVGNAVEHITAVTVAMKDKMDLSMGVAVGSSAQISLFVVPVVTLYAWSKDINMTLNFPMFEIMLYVLSILIVTGCVSNGKSNWLEGSLLITTYVMIAVGFWFEKVKDF